MHRANAQAALPRQDHQRRLHLGFPPAIVVSQWWCTQRCRARVRGGEYVADDWRVFPVFQAKNIVISTPMTLIAIPARVTTE